MLTSVGRWTLWGLPAKGNLLPPSLQSTILGHLEDLQVTAGSRYHATIRFRGDLLSGECSDVLVGHSMFLWRRRCDHAEPEPGRVPIVELGSVLGRDAIVVLLQNILCL